MAEVKASKVLDDVRQARDRMMRSRVAGVIADATLPDLPIYACNQAFLDLTGYSRSEVIGRNCRFLSHPSQSPSETRTFRRAIRDRLPALVEIVNYRKSGQPFLNGVTIAPIFDARGKLAAYLGTQTDLSREPGERKGSVDEDARAKLDLLTPRQKEAIVLLAGGMPIKQIAHGLGLSERTVKMHRAKALERLGVESSAEAVRLAVRAGY